MSKTRIKSKKLKKRNLLTVSAVVILLLTAVLGFGVQKRTEKICARAEELLENAVKSSEAGDFSAAEENAERLMEFWDSKTAYFGLFYEHDTSARILEGIARLAVYAEGENIVSVKAEAETLRAQLNVLSKYDEVSGVNIV